MFRRNQKVVTENFFIEPKGDKYFRIYRNNVQTWEKFPYQVLFASIAGCGDVSFGMESPFYPKRPQKYPQKTQKTLKFFLPGSVCINCWMW
jgi:hypothetical protein